MNGHVTLPTYSMFTTTPVYEVDGEFVFGLRRESVLPHATDDLWKTTQAAENRLDLVSELFYGVPNLWWVIAAVNNITDPLTGVPAGTQLRIPKAERLADEGILNS